MLRKPYVVILPALALLCSIGIIDAEPTAPATQPAEQLTERQKNLLLQLSDAEANIQAINKALRVTGYKVGMAYDRIESNHKGNELMDRKGGGPVRWDDFYGRTARDFYAPRSWGIYHREGNGKTIDAEVAANYFQLHRPPQFDYIYKANNDQIARATKQIASLQHDQAALLDRRHFHESEQSRLWATLAWGRIKDQEIVFRPLYRFALKPSGPDAAVLRPIIRFLRVADIVSADGLRSLNGNQAATFTRMNEQVQEAYAVLQQALADALIATDLKQEHRAEGEALKILCKRLAEEAEIISDNYRKAIDSDRAREDASKLEFRGELQASLAYFAAATAELDQRIVSAANSWGVAGESGIANPDEASLVLPAPATSPSDSSDGLAPPRSAIVVTSPNRVLLAELKVGAPRLYDSRPLRTIEGIADELRGYQFISIPQRIDISYQVRVGKAGILYVFGFKVGSHVSREDVFGAEASKWELADGAITGTNIDGVFRRKVVPGDVISVKWFEANIAAESIELNPHDAAPAPAETFEPSASAEDRKAAYYVLRLGGKVYVTSDDQETEIDDATKLPATPFLLTGIRFHDVKSIVDRDLLPLRTLTSVKRLWLSGTQVTDAGIGYISNLKSLEVLYLGGTVTTDRAMDAVAQLKHLKHLGLYFTKVSDRGIEKLRGLTELKEVNVGGTHISDRAILSVLPGCKISRPK